MQFITEYSDIEEARSESASIAAAKGCGRNPEDITRYWYAVYEHPSSRRGAIEVEDDYPTPSGKQKNTRAEMVSAGWFSEQQGGGRPK